MAVKKDEATGKWMYYGSYKLNGKTKQYKKRGFEKKKDAIKAEILFKENLKEPNSVWVKFNAFLNSFTLSPVVKKITSFISFCH